MQASKPDLRERVATRPAKREILPACVWFLLFTALASAMYLEIFAYAGFGPEFAYFYQVNGRLSFWGMLHKYFEFGEKWYRPTAFYAPYWLISKFIGWHHILLWKFANYATFLAMCAALYATTLLLFPRKHLAAFLACVYLAANPCVYLPLYEISAFDFVYLFLVLVSFAAFWLAWRAEPGRAGWLNLCGVASYLMALTSKEASLVTPVYLSAAAAVLLFVERDRGPLSPGIRRAARMLAPYFAVMALYALLHITRIPPQPVDADYRTQPNADRILENVRNYFSWMIHVFRHTGPQGAYLATAENDWFGYVTLALLAAQWSADFRNKVNRTQAVLLVIWILIFSAIPIYAGAYIWHNNIALCGYSMLVGVGLARFLTVFRRQVLRHLYMIVLLSAFFLLGREDVGRALYAGVHAPCYQVNHVRLFRNPPVPADRVTQDALFYIEDREENGFWCYGVNNLFALAYDQPGVRQVAVPPMERISAEQCANWLKHHNAFFVRYHSPGHWEDATAEFRAYALVKVQASGAAH